MKRTFEQKAEVFWRWLLRLVGVGAFVYVLLFNTDVPVAVYALIGGLIGLPNIISLQQALNEKKGG